MSKPGNLTAFPCVEPNPDGTPAVFNPGMELRDWFAGMVLMGICANPDMSGNNAATASVAYHVADAMLAERAKGDAA